MLDIIVITYNRKKMLEELIESLEFQSFQDFSLIIADDGSKEVINPLQYKKISAFICARDTGYNKTARLNDAIKYIKNDKVLFLDDDCLPSNENYLKKINNDLDEYDLVFGSVFFNCGLTPTNKSGQNWAVRAKHLNGIQFDMSYNGRYGFEDWDMFEQLEAKGLKIAPISEETKVIHRGKLYNNGIRQTPDILCNTQIYNQKWKKEYKWKCD